MTRPRHVGGEIVFVGKPVDRDTAMWIVELDLAECRCAMRAGEAEKASVVAERLIGWLTALNEQDKWRRCARVAGAEAKVTPGELPFDWVKTREEQSRPINARSLAVKPMQINRLGRIAGDLCGTCASDLQSWWGTP